MKKTNSKQVKAYFNELVKDLEKDELKSAIEAYNDNIRFETGIESQQSLIKYTINMKGGFGPFTCWYSEMREELAKALEENEEQKTNTVMRQSSILIAY